MVRTIRTCSGVAAGLAAIFAGVAQADAPASLAAYVRGRAADGDGRADVAAASYAAALTAAPDNPVVAIRAYREALSAGDMPLARRAAAVLSTAGVAPADAVILAIADAVSAKDWARANAAADRLADSQLAFLAPSVRGWLAFGRGQPNAARIDAGPNAISRRFAAENGALLLIASGERDAGLAALRPLLTSDALGRSLRLSAAHLLSGTGDDAGARALLAGEAQAAATKNAPAVAKPTAAYGIAQLYTRLATDIATSDARPLAVVLSRAALQLQPDSDGARLVLASALASDANGARALALLDRIDPAGEYGSQAASMRISLLSRAGQTEPAIAAAAAVAAAPGSTSVDAQRQGDLLLAADRFGEAAQAYATAIDRAGADADWVLYLQRGGALDQAGRWPEARTSLQRAVELAPDEAVALNYLGYAQIARGENMTAARTMLERAARLKPDDPNIADSLGWAYVQRGDTAGGLPLIERAARDQPANAEIRDHLGDAYWRLGRRYEARYAWRAAAESASGEEAVRLRTKLVSGLQREPR